jgi:UDP-N-acetylglucosamine--N-acetylmuramyl-(pentapeptide) pyrophosphoryl-undecaprenol N-acetylglucosamine transferase
MPAPALRFAGRSGPLKLLVVGGSLGARVLNEIVPAALSQLPAEARPQVTHQTGAAHLDEVRGRYATLGVQAEVLPFIDNMDQRLADCDLMLCRAGAITVSELCAAGVASMLVPLVVSTTSHQRDNATWMAERGAAVHLPQAELEPQRLASLLLGLDRTRLQAMAESARALAEHRSAGRVADEIEKAVAR